ncbi:MAG: phosphoribosylaminoimidazolesuccinocarboxamide synthase [Litorilinea sp.]
MLESSVLETALDTPLDQIDLPFLQHHASGKVREIYTHADRLVLVTTDRLSAFDRILGVVPYKGQVLNQLAAFWFEQTRDIVANHLLATPDPNVTVARRCTPLPVEIIVRGYITGVTETALWYRYSQGERMIYGIPFADGMSKNDVLPAPIITPTTKGQHGAHDERITPREIVERGLMAEALWEDVAHAAIALFRRGQEIAAAAGLLLVDTKYEFGVDAAGKLVLIDEMHTPDSSRFWIADSYASRHAAGQEPENYDKEFIRLYYAEHGYRGEGEPFPLPRDVALTAAQRYIHTYELLTGQTFAPGEWPAGPRIARNLQNWLTSAG